MHTALNTVEIFFQVQEDDTKILTTGEQLIFRGYHDSETSQ